jgi:hypothetical protein
MLTCKDSETNVKWKNNSVCVKCPSTSDTMIQSNNSFLCPKPCRNGFSVDSQYPQFCINEKGTAYMRTNDVPQLSLPKEVSLVSTIPVISIEPIAQNKSERDNY